MWEGKRHKVICVAVVDTHCKGYSTQACRVRAMLSGLGLGLGSQACRVRAMLSGLGLGLCSQAYRVRLSGMQGLGLSGMQGSQD